MRGHGLILAWRLAGALCAVSRLATAEAAPPADAHAEHRAMDAAVQRSEANYTPPDVRLVRDDGKNVSLPSELDDGRPVVLNFIYTSCTSICPMSSQVFEQFQERLGDRHESVHLVSISIDPDQDTPARLRAYARQFHAVQGWNHYTGTVAAISAVQRAFNAYRGDKMSHTAITLVRGAPGKPWIRIDGYASLEDLLAESLHWPADVAGR